MSDKNYVVPKEGLAAALEAAGSTLRDTEWKHVVAVAVHAFIRWQSENPRVPTDKQIKDMWTLYANSVEVDCAGLLAEWQRRMYLAPEPEVPEKIKDLLLDLRELKEHAWHEASICNEKLIEAYRRGKRAG
jgi:hypothetical protein